MNAVDAGPEDQPGDRAAERPSQRSAARAGDGPRGRSRLRLAVLWPFALFFVFSTAVVGWHIHEFSYISPIDEGSHLDYIQRLPHVPDVGERLGHPALDEVACRTLGAQFAYPLPKCGTDPYPPGGFPSEGYSTAGATPPVYYAVTAVIARPLAAMTGQDQLTMVRWVGVLWLTGLLSVSFLLARRLGVPVLGAVGAALLIGTSSDVISSASTAGPDVAAALAGGLVVLAALAHDGSRRRLAWLLAAVAVATLVKFTVFTAVGVAMFVVVGRAYLTPRDPHPDPTRGSAWGRGGSWLLSGAMLAIFGLLSFAWGLRYKLTAKIDPELLPINAPFITDHLDWATFRATASYAFLTPAHGNWNAPFLDNVYNGRVEGIVVGVCILGALGAALSLRSAPLVSALGLGVVAMAVAGPWMLVLLNFYVNHLAFLISPRYGFALLPAFAAATAWTMRARPAGGALVLLAGLSLLSLVAPTLL